MSAAVGQRLNGKVAVITGGGSAIGRAVAALFAHEGADVAIVYLPADEPDARATADAVAREGRTALLLPGDVTDPDFCHRAVRRSVATFGHLDILVNNAAYFLDRTDSDASEDEQCDQAVGANVYGYFYMAKAALPEMRQGGAIVNCGAIAAAEPGGELLDDAATSGAIHAFTRSLARNLVGCGVRVNCVAPGSRSSADASASSRSGGGTPLAKILEFPGKSPVARATRPDELAPAFVLLAAESDSDFITGEILTIAGGETTRA